MALQQTHVGFLKEVLSETFISLNDLDKVSLYFGAVYPDMFYVSLYNSSNNFSLYLHNHQKILSIGHELFLNAKNSKERSFALGFISHIFLDNRIHGYLKKINSFESADHLALEFHLHALLSHSNKIYVSKVPLKLLKSVFSKHVSSKRFIHNLNANYFKRKLFLFICNYLQIETFKLCYLKSKKNFFKKALLKIPYFFAYNQYEGYSVSRLFNPDFVFLKSHSSKLLKEYDLAKKDFISFIKKNGLLHD